MFLTGLLIGFGLGLIGAALIIAVSYLSTSTIRTRVSTEIPEAAYVEIQKIYENKGVTTLPVYKAKAYNRSHQKIKDIEFQYESSEYFYDGEKITIY